MAVLASCFVVFDSNDFILNLLCVLIVPAKSIITKENIDAKTTTKEPFDISYDKDMPGNH